MENVVPLVLSLYRMLQSKKSGLIRYVVPYFSKLMKEYKDEVTEVLGADNRIVAEEIEFALKKEAQKQAERERKETLKHAREKAKQNRMSVSTSRRVSAVGAGKTPIPTTATRSRRKTFGGNAGKCHITPFSKSVISSAKRPSLHANSAPRLKMTPSVLNSMSASASKPQIRKTVRLSGSATPGGLKTNGSARKWSIKPTKVATAIQSEDGENKDLNSKQDLTGTLLGM